MRKRKGLKEQVPGYENVRFWFTLISVQCVANTFTVLRQAVKMFHTRLICFQSVMAANICL
jgi:hypothetical protein